MEIVRNAWDSGTVQSRGLGRLMFLAIEHTVMYRIWMNLRMNIMLITRDVRMRIVMGMMMLISLGC